MTARTKTAAQKKKDAATARKKKKANSKKKTAKTVVAGKTPAAAVTPAIQAPPLPSAPARPLPRQLTLAPQPGTGATVPARYPCQAGLSAPVKVTKEATRLAAILLGSYGVIVVVFITWATWYGLSACFPQ